MDMGSLVLFFQIIGSAIMPVAFIALYVFVCISFFSQKKKKNTMQPDFNPEKYQAFMILFIILTIIIVSLVLLFLGMIVLLSAFFESM